MLLVLKNITTLDSFTFDFLTELEFTQSVEKLTTLGSLIIPKKLQYKRNGQIITNVIEGKDPLFKRGTPVTISAGYDSTVNQIFKGFVSDVIPRLPLEFSIQDEMFKLKQVTISNYSKNNLTLKQLLTDILPSGYKFNALDVNLGWFRIKRSNVVAVFEHLRTHYGLTCNFRNGVLYAGLRYITTNPLELNIHEFEFEKNIIDDSKLIYNREDDVLIKLKAISIDGKNHKIETEVGDTDGDQRTMYFYGLGLADLKKIAAENLSKMKYEGFFGSFDTFLLPKVVPGDAVRMINKRLPEKNGVYLVKEVTTRIGPNIGGRQTIHLDRKVA